MKLARSWDERGIYGNIIKDLLKKQIKKYGLERDKIKATKISQNIGYLIQVQNSLIKESENSEIEKRLEELEKKVRI